MKRKGNTWIPNRPISPSIPLNTARQAIADKRLVLSRGKRCILSLRNKYFVRAALRVRTTVGEIGPFPFVSDI